MHAAASRHRPARRCPAGLSLGQRGVRALREDATQCPVDAGKGFGLGQPAPGMHGDGFGDH
eukprot:3589135-Alexandrium_andersonii.AAC.1